MRCVILDVDEKNFNEVKIVYYFIGRETLIANSLQDVASSHMFTVHQVKGVIN